MSSKKDLDEVLAATEAVAGTIVAQHDDGCMTGEIARFIQSTCHEARESLAAGSGPAQVATAAYRRNYETIFGKQPRGQA